MKSLILLLGIVSVIFISGCTQTGQVTGNCRDVTEAYQDCSDVQVPYQDCETVSYTDQECTYEHLAYTSSDNDMTRRVICIAQHQECIKYFYAGICEEYEKVCDTYKETASFDLKNLDTVQGTWFFNWMRECKSGEPSCDTYEPVIYSKETVTLNPKVTRTMRAEIEYDADAEENLYVEFIYIPEKEICSDVVKYREVCDPEIKYRTEEKCETKYRTVQKCD